MLKVIYVVRYIFIPFRVLPTASYTGAGFQRGDTMKLREQGSADTPQFTHETWKTVKYPGAIKSGKDFYTALVKGGVIIHDVVRRLLRYRMEINPRSIKQRLIKYPFLDLCSEEDTSYAHVLEKGEELELVHCSFEVVLQLLLNSSQKKGVCHKESIVFCTAPITLFDNGPPHLLHAKQDMDGIWTLGHCLGNSPLDHKVDLVFGRPILPH